MIDNIDIAILTRTNELAERHGFKPYEFIATVQYEKGGSGHLPGNRVLAFEIPYSGDAGREEVFFGMLDGLGVGETTGRLIGTEKSIIDALDAALAKAPRMRGR